MRVRVRDGSQAAVSAAERPTQVMGCSLRLLSDGCCGPRGRYCAAHPCALAGGRSVNLRCVEPTRLLARVGSRGSHASRRLRVRAGLGASGRRSRLDAAVRCSRRRRSLRELPLGTAARPRLPFSGGRGRRPALGAVSAGGQPWLVSLPAEGRAFIVIVRDSRKLDSQRPRPAGWMGGRAAARQLPLFCHPCLPHLCRLCSFHTGAVLSAGVYAADVRGVKNLPAGGGVPRGLTFSVRVSGVDDSDCRHPCRRVHG